MTDIKLNAISTAPREETARPVLWIVGLSLLAWAVVGGIAYLVIRL